MKESPYYRKPQSEWLTITKQLIKDHPLQPAALLDAALSAWDTLWSTTIGAGKTSVRLSEVNVPATVVGYFFEILLARELKRREPEKWRGNVTKDEKDLVYIPDPTFSIELKSSGQCGFKVYGNRSAGQEAANDDLVKKEKSGYYATVNFFGRTLTLLRFGWLDADDWTPQKAPTGQMAGLSETVYKNKLIAVPGRYRQAGPVILLNGVGDSRAKEFESLNIRTIGDLLRYDQELPQALARIKRDNDALLKSCVDNP